MLNSVVLSKACQGFVANGVPRPSLTCCKVRIETRKALKTLNQLCFRDSHTGVDGAVCPRQTREGAADAGFVCIKMKVTTAPHFWYLKSLIDRSQLIALTGTLLFLVGRYLLSAENC